MDRLELMNTFVRIVEAGSLSAAARKLKMTQPTVSKQLRALEAQLGTQLLQRNTRRMSLSEAGHHYYQRARRVLEEVEALEASVREDQQGLSGLLRVNAPVGIGESLLTGFLLDFQRQHPALSIDLDLTDRFVNLVEEGVDLAVRIGPLQETTLVARKVGVIERVLVASPSYLQRHGEPAHPQELPRYNYIRFSRLVAGAQLQLEGPKGLVTVETRSRFLVNNSQAVRAALLGGFGVGLAPVWLVHDALADGRLVRILPHYQLPPSELHFLFPSRRYIQAKVRALVNFLQTRLTAVPGLHGTQIRL